MYQALNKQRQLNDMRERHEKIKDLLKDTPQSSELYKGLHAEAMEINRLLPLIEKHVSDVSASSEQQEKEVLEALANEEKVKEKTSKLLMTLIQKRNQLVADKAKIESESARLEYELANSIGDPETQAEIKASLAKQEAKMTRLNQVKEALDYNQANAKLISEGGVQFRVVDPQAMADIAMRKRGVDAAEQGTIAHDQAEQMLRDEQDKAEREFFAEVGAYVKES